jgi:hypothetical protein
MFARSAALKRCRNFAPAAVRDAPEKLLFLFLLVAAGGEHERTTKRQQ